MKKKQVLFLCILLTSSSVLNGCITPNEQKNCVLINNEQEFTSLQDALNASENGDEILLCKGTYVGGVIINKSVTIRGKNKKDTFLIPSQKNNAILLINAKNCQIDSFTIMTEQSSNPSRFIKGIEINKDSCHISNMIIQNCTYAVYCVQGSKNHLITSNVIAFNQNGIELFNSDYNSIEQNTIHNSSQFGILLFEEAMSNIIKENTFLHNNEGVRLKGTEVKENQIINNNFTNNTEAIHECCGAGSNIILNNDIN